LNPFAADAVRGAYDRVAVDYAATFGDDLARLPLDRQVLDRALTLADPGGRVLEAGCGPAPALAYFGDRVERGLGVDLSREMLATAAAATGGARPVAQADLRALPLHDESCALVIAFYVLQHLPRGDELDAGLAECARVTAPRGVLAVATHLGDGDVVLEEFLGHRIEPMAGALHDRDDLVGRLVRAGFVVIEEHQRDPLPHEYPSRRLYLLARRT
jgi:SAM-dependent methyltransferase